MMKRKKKSNQNLRSGNFFQSVYEVVRLIPKGRVTSYGAIARYLGTAGSSRMVGWAMNGSHREFPPVPAQRVVNRSGLLTGKQHFGSPDLMAQLLENEGIKIVKNQVVDFENVFWDPTTELYRSKSGLRKSKQ